MKKLTELIKLWVSMLSVDTSNMETIDVFEDENGVWHFRKDNVVWGNFPTFEDARRIAEEYNFYKVRKVNQCE